MTTPEQALARIHDRVIPGQRFPEWAVPTRSGHLIGLVCETPWARNRWQLQQTVRADTFASVLRAGLLTLGELEDVPEYEGSVRGLRWEPGRRGRRITAVCES